MAQVIRLDRKRQEPVRCGALTASGRPCRNVARTNGFCARHQPPAAPERIGPFDAESVRSFLAYLRRRITGEFHVDEFGFDDEFVEEILLPALRGFHRYYWRVRWKGLENVPSRGPALLVANHAGALPLDALVLKLGVLDVHPAHRHIRLLAADLVFRMPFVGTLGRKLGSTLACDEDSLRLFSRGDLVAVFPEGFKGVGKSWRHRYRLQRFGRGGFVTTALRAKVSIVPVSIVGSEEIYPMIHDAKSLARLAGLPYFPITPFFPWLGPLGLVPLPSKWIVEFARPIRTEHFAVDASEDAMLAFELTDRVRETIQEALYRNLRDRNSVFL